jgi:hypothetical protein
MGHKISRLVIGITLLFYIIFHNEPVYCQLQKGRILSGPTGSGIGYVNVVIVGKAIGTVSDVNGNFSILLDKISNNDSIRFSIIGYESKTLTAGQLKADSTKTIILNPRSYALTEVKVVYHKARKPKEIRLGDPVSSDELKSGFDNNSLGSEMGIKVEVDQKVLLKDLNLDVATCTYDSVTYRLNIYKLGNRNAYTNILTEPVYIHFSKDDIRKTVTCDLSKYSIYFEGNLIIALELYKDLGEGSLLFRTAFFTGYTCHRKTISETWIEAPGVIGMYLHGIVVNDE